MLSTSNHWSNETEFSKVISDILVTLCKTRHTLTRYFNQTEHIYCVTLLRDYAIESHGLCSLAAPQALYFSLLLQLNLKLQTHFDEQPHATIDSTNINFNENCITSVNNYITVNYWRNKGFIFKFSIKGSAASIGSRNLWGPPEGSIRPDFTQNCKDRGIYSTVQYSSKKLDLKSF